MKTSTYIAGTILLLLIGLIFAGCSDDDHDLMSTDGDTPPAIAAISPTDGSTGVPVTTSVSLKFTGPVDTLSVMRNLYLAGGQPMHEWRDSLEHHGGFGMIGMMMHDRMMHWIDSIQVPGEFHWNAAMDSCAFVSDSALMHGSEYLCLLYEGGMRGQHGGMMGGDHGDSGYHMLEFTTEP